MIVNVGHDVIEKPPFFMQAGGAEVIHVTFRSAEVDPVYFPQIEVIGDIANAIWQIKEDIVPGRRWTFDADARRRARPSAPIRRASEATRAFRSIPPYLVRQGP